MTVLEQALEGTKSVAILGHVRPDGDCLGSTLGLYNYLLASYPDIQAAVYLEEASSKFAYLKGYDEIHHETDDREYELCICLDSSDEERLGDFKVYLKRAKKSLCIDHHITNTRYCEINLVAADASSASEVLYDLLDNELFDKDIAEPMYMGIAHDSGVFRFQSTSPKTMRIAANMIEHGVEVNEILEETFFRKTYKQMMVTAKIQSEAVLTMDGKCIYGFCTNETMEEYGVTKSDLDAVIGAIRNVDGVEVALFVYQLDENKFKASLRSKRYVDVSEIAVSFGGGGHVRAAGFDIEGSLEDVIEKVLKKINNVI